jgi:hypothetical protein
MKSRLHIPALIRKLPLVVLTFIVLSFFMATSANAWWDIRAIDTMKLSRDMAREYVDGKDKELDAQVALIADTGATHIAIGTPYDPEFLPATRKWVRAARKYGLKVWFRGNWSGWEEWFDHDRISREEHLEMTREFILDNPSLFEDGDIFSACPECENGGPGDPRQTGDAEGFTQFLIDEHIMMEEAFNEIDKDVQFNVNSMNGDVARLIMNKKTTAALGGVISVDHYVRTPEQLAEDIEEYATQSGGKVFLGEMGAPIPDIHGNMTETQQAEWLDEALMLLAQADHVAGINYWTAFGGSTAIWSSQNQPKQAVAILKKYFKPETVDGSVVSTTQQTVGEVTVMSQMKETTGLADGTFSLPYLEKEGNVIFSKEGYYDKVVPFVELEDGAVVEMEPLEIGFADKLRLFINSILTRFFTFSKN